MRLIEEEEDPQTMNRTELRRAGIHVLLAVLALGLGAGCALAQQPERPQRFVVPSIFNPPQAPPPQAPRPVDQPVPQADPFPPQEGPSISSRVTMVSLNLVVTDSTGFPVSGLTSDDIQILDNGKEIPLGSFQETSRPMDLLILLDSSGSTYKKISLIKQGAADFVRTVHENLPRDRVAVINFNDDIEMLAPFGMSWREKVSLIQDRVEATGGTSLFDAIWLTCRDVLPRSFNRKTVVLYTDGIDSRSLKSFADAERMALASDATFHILTVDNLQQARKDVETDYYALTRRQYYAFLQGEKASLSGTVDPMWTASMHRQVSARDVLDRTYQDAYAQLQKLATESGGQFHKVSSYEELPYIYSRIASELPYYYTVSYTPDLSGAKVGDYRTIEIRLRRPGLVVRHRQGYYVSGESRSGIR